MRRTHSMRGFPVASGSIPGLGHILSLHRDALAVFRRVRSEVGPVFWMNIGFGIFRLIYLGPDSVDLYQDSRISLDFNGFTSGSELTAGSLFEAEGADHRRMRAELHGSFLPSGLAGYPGSSMARVADEVVASWVARGEVGALSAAQAIALRMVFAVVGAEPSDMRRWQSVYRAAMLSVVPIPWVSRAISDQAVGWLNRRLVRLLDGSRGKPTLLGRLVSRCDVGAISRREAVGNLRALVLAGHETTASSIAWAVIKVIGDARWWARLVNEVGDRATPTSLADASGFPVASMIFREVTRLYPPAWISPRRVKEDVQLACATIPSGVSFALSPMWVSRDSSVFPDPDEFNPERWAGRKPTAAEITSFGGGPHFCLGYHMAMLEGVQCLVSLARATKGRRPRLTGKRPAQRYMPSGHPTLGTRIAYDV